MKNNNVKQSESEESKELALHYFKTLVEVARESFLILDSNLRVVSANPIFYQNFRVLPEKTEGVLLYKLGNGQWNIPELKKLLEEILPTTTTTTTTTTNSKVVKNYEVTHVFEKIGTKTMLLNASQIDSVKLIILAIEDITDKKQLENELSEYAKGQEIKITQRTKELADKVKELESVNKSMVGRELKMVELKKEIEKLKKSAKNGNHNGNGKNGNGNGNHKNGRKNEPRNTRDFL